MSGPGKRLRNKFVDAPGSVGDRARTKRWDQFHEYFPQIEDMSVIDLGGRGGMWTRAPFRPKHVHLVNLEPQQGEFPDWITAETGDATEIAAQADAPQYDLVFSNSVIEHVGGYANRTSFARAVEDLAPRHWIQTPYRYFPVEPHFIFPGFQFLPLSARAELLRRWPLVHSRPTTSERALEIALSVELLSRAELRFLFPESVIVAERIGGVTKSLIAVRR